MLLLLYQRRPQLYSAFVFALLLHADMLDPPVEFEAPSHRHIALIIFIVMFEIDDIKFNRSFFHVAFNKH